MTASARRFDAVLAAVLVVLTQLEAWLGPYDDRLVLSAACGAMAGPLAVRRRHPLPVALVVTLAFCLGQAATGSVTELASGTLPLLVATYTGAAYLPLRQALAAGAAALVGALASVVASPEPPTTSNYVYASLVVGVSWSVGRVLSSRHAEVSALEERQQAAAEEAVAAERARIARELHDVVAHGVSVMVLQAGAAEQVMQVRPDEAREALRSVQATGRAALTELRRMLELLRDADPATELHPQPGLRDVTDLAERAGAAGLPVEVDLDPAALDVPPAVALSAYRIVQEALTNSLKHAGPATARVRLSREADRLVIEVSDTGRGRTAGVPGTGHGLLGMRERVSVFGGTLSLDDTEGFQVRAELPVGAAS